MRWQRQDIWPRNSLCTVSFMMAWTWMSSKDEKRPKKGRIKRMKGPTWNNYSQWRHTEESWCMMWDTEPILLDAEMLLCELEVRVHPGWLHEECSLIRLSPTWLVNYYHDCWKAGLMLWQITEFYQILFFFRLLWFVRPLVKNDCKLK